MPSMPRRPKKSQESLLFHPKKKQHQRNQAGVSRPPVPLGGVASKPSTPPSSASTPKADSEPGRQGAAAATTPGAGGSPAATPAPAPTPTPTPTSTATSNANDEDEEDLQLPAGPFQEYRLMSSALNGWKYDVMKFESRRPVDISAWVPPIKLNRKELRRDERGLGPGGGGGGVGGVAVAPMLGPDGKPVVGPDGALVMVDADGRPVQSLFASASTSTSAGAAVAAATAAGGKDKGKQPFGNGKKKFQKKTRQVFLVPEATRQLRKEERHPWVMEDASGKEVWVGKVEDLAKSDTHAFFMPAANDVFKFVPAHRWYKFQKKPSYHIPNLEEAESIMARMQKNKDPERWLLHNRNGKAPSSATAAVFKAEAEGRIAGLPSSSQPQVSLVGGRKLKTVEKGTDGLFGDDDEDGGTKRRKRQNEAEGDVDEMTYDLEFTDDEEHAHEDGEDEEAKELEERLKREYKNANKQREGHVVESDDEEEDGLLTKDGKAMRKLIRTLEKNAAYESDEERNPYASSEVDDEEEEEEATAAEAAAQPPPRSLSQPPSRSGSQAPGKGPSSRSQTQPGSRAVSRPTSRATSPAPASPPLGGHSVVAKRATSPKGTTTKPSANGIVGAPGHRGTSPNGTAVRQGTPMALKVVNNKRKASEDVSSVSGSAARAISPGGTQKPKKRKGQLLMAAATATATAVAAAGELEDRMVIEWLKNTPDATTRDCIQYFTPYLTDEGKKSKFTALVKEVAQLKGGVLVLRSGYRGGGESLLL